MEKKTCCMCRKDFMVYLEDDYSIIIADFDTSPMRLDPLLGVALCNECTRILYSNKDEKKAKKAQQSIHPKLLWNSKRYRRDLYILEHLQNRDWAYEFFRRQCNVIPVSVLRDFEIDPRGIVLGEGDENAIYETGS